MNWNRSFTDLIRNARPAYWGNWALDSSLQPGAVGFVSPGSGNFTLVQKALPDVRLNTNTIPNQWKLSSSNVQRTEASVNIQGSGTVPETGTKVTAGVEVTWQFASVGSLASEFGISSESYISDLTVLTTPKNLQWLAQQAQAVSMGENGNIAQGFGVITNVIYAHSGLNVGSQDDSSAFSITGKVGAVQDMLAGVDGKGSYTSTKQTKSVDQHLWPDAAGKEPDALVPIAYTFASFEGTLLIPNWINHLGAFEILFNNVPGCTYITSISLSYDTPQGRQNQSFTLSGGISKNVANIPLSATNIHVEVTFKGMINSDHYTFNWANPLGQWLTGKREIRMTGVWPGHTSAVAL